MIRVEAHRLTTTCAVCLRWTWLEGEEWRVVVAVQFAVVTTLDVNRVTATEGIQFGQITDYINNRPHFQIK